MTSFNNFPDRNRDQQDGIERHIYSYIEHVKTGGRYMKAKGTGTQDEEIIVQSPWGLGGAYAKDTDAEVMVSSGGSDTNQKYGMVDTPVANMRNWKEGTNGIQSHQKATDALVFGEDVTSITSPHISLAGGLIEIVDGKIYFRGEVHIPNLKSIGTGAPKVPKYDDSNDQEATS